MVNNRPHGTGGVHLRTADNLWVARIRIRGQRKQFTSKDRDVAVAKLDAWIAGMHPELLDRTMPKGTTRGEALKAARKIATHTPEEWSAIVAAAGGKCAYCKRTVGCVPHKDHIHPITRGGSDGADNLTLACADCNMAKGAMTVAEFLEWAEGWGFFAQPRTHYNRKLRHIRRARRRIRNGY